MIGSTLLTLLVTAFPGQAPGKLAEVGTVILVAPFDRSEDLKAWRDVGPDVRIVPGSSAACVRIERPVERGPGAAMIRTPLPIDAIRGCRVRYEAFIKAEDVVAPPHLWNGVKFMVHTVGVPDTWQQRDNLHGSFDWRPIRYVATIPRDATGAELVLGLEQTTGRAFFDRVELTVVGRPRTASRPVGAGAADRRIETPRLRGVMVNPPTLTAADLNALARVWKANHVRWQLTWAGFPHSPAYRAYRASYDGWLDSQLAHLDELLPTCEQLGIHVLIDLHTPPGGRDEASVCRISARSAGLPARDYLRDVIEVFEEHGWDWAYHAFREWDGWSVEHGPNRDEHKRADAPTDRETLLRSWFERNARP